MVYPWTGPASKPGNQLFAQRNPWIVCEFVLEPLNTRNPWIVHEVRIHNLHPTCIYIYISIL